jgi:alpha/beta superfamily hydrolase
VILQIDVTVTGPDGVMTGSTAVAVNEPTAPAVILPAQAQPPGDLANLRMRQRAQALRGGVSRA